MRPAEALRTLHAISRDWVLNVGAVLGKHPASCSWCVTSSGGFGTVLGAAHCTISWGRAGNGGMRRAIRGLRIWDSASALRI